MSEGSRVRIHYRRLPDHEEVFDQRVVLDRADVIVTVTDPIQLSAPLRSGGYTLLEPGARAVWFTFPNAWHDVGRFHLRDGTFTGYYANILTPPRIEGPIWHTTDLFLDVWIPDAGTAVLLDEDEFDDALQKAYMDPVTASNARAEADRLLRLATEGTWPPPVVREWTLDRIQAGEAAAKSPTRPPGRRHTGGPRPREGGPAPPDPRASSR